MFLHLFENTLYYRDDKMVGAVTNISKTKISTRSRFEVCGMRTMLVILCGALVV